MEDGGIEVDWESKRRRVCEGEMMKGLKQAYGVTGVRNPIGNHIPISWSGHETEKKYTEKKKDERKRWGRLKMGERRTKGDGREEVKGLKTSDQGKEQNWGGKKQWTKGRERVFLIDITGIPKSQSTDSIKIIKP